MEFPLKGTAGAHAERRGEVLTKIEAAEWVRPFRQAP
jgi:hypothetical protein